jgi:starch phosphorylase
VKYKIQFGGRVLIDESHGENDRRATWVDTDDVQAMAYDTLVPGYGTQAVNTLRLWSATATEEIDLSLFNRGDYSAAIEEKNHSENVSRVLYPDDSTEHGRELRLRQEYFFVSASLQDLLRRYFKTQPSVEQLADSIAIHLNDTHPAIAIPELMRPAGRRPPHPVDARLAAHHEDLLVHEPHADAGGARDRGRSSCSSACCRGT